MFTANNAWERVLLFDGTHAVGLDKSGVNWIFRTLEGEVIDLGKFDCVEDNYALFTFLEMDIHSPPSGMAHSRASRTAFPDSLERIRI